jgi:Bacterial type II and III secretion system protein
VTKHLQTLAVVFVCALASTAIVRAQEKDKPAAPAPKPAATPLRIQVVISRYQGEKKISSLPYNLTTNAGNRATIRMGTQVPVMMLAMGQAEAADAKTTPQAGPIQYKDVGTNLDCTSMALDDGRFLLSLTVDDSSVYPDERTAIAGGKGNPSFRSFRASNSMMLRNGETGQITTATDKVTGETVKVDVTLVVVK